MRQSLADELNFIRLKHMIRMDADTGWVTMNGTHVLLGEGGVAMSGGKLKGRAFTNAKSQKRTPKGGGGTTGSGGSGSSGSAAEAQKPAEPHTLAKGDDISETWERRPDKFPNEIDDVIDAQGYNGKPRVVSKEEFDKAVAASGFVAQRTFAAPDEQTLADYDEQLKSGDFYVDCSTGGAQYGQGCYTVGDYTGTISDGMKEEVKHYQELGESRNRATTAENAERRYLEDNLDLNDETTRLVYKYDVLHQNTDDDGSSIFKKLKNIDDDKLDKVESRVSQVAKQADEEKKKILSMSQEDYIKTHTKVKTITLDPSAKIVKYNDLMDEYNPGVSDEVYAKADKAAKKAMKSESDGLSSFDKAYVKWASGTGGAWRKGFDEMNKTRPDLVEKANRVKSAYDEIYKPAREEADKKWKAIHDKYKDIGSYAAAKGYSAINAEGHGKSGSYTIILDRTRMIMLDD